MFHMCRHGLYWNECPVFNTSCYKQTVLETWMFVMYKEFLLSFKTNVNILSAGVHPPGRQNSARSRRRRPGAPHPSARGARLPTLPEAGEGAAQRIRVQVEQDRQHPTAGNKLYRPNKQTFHAGFICSVYFLILHLCKICICCHSYSGVWS